MGDFEFLKYKVPTKMVNVVTAIIEKDDRIFAT